MNKQQIKQQARETLTKARETILDIEGWVAGERGKVDQRLGRYETLAAVALSRAMDSQDVIGGKTTALDVAAKLYPDASKGTLYRYRHAGTVARVLMGEREGETNLLGDLPAAMRGSLVPLYRVLDLTAKSDEARDAGRKLARDTYAGLLKASGTTTIETREGDTIEVPVAPTFPEVLAAAEKARPTNRSGGGKASSDDDEGDDTGDEGGTDQASSASLVVVDAAAVEAASGPVAAIVAGLVREGHDETAVRASFAAALRLAAEWGVGTVQAVIAGKVPQAADETTPGDEKAADEAAAQDEGEKVAA